MQLDTKLQHYYEVLAEKLSADIAQTVVLEGAAKNQDVKKVLNYVLDNGRDMVCMNTCTLYKWKFKGTGCGYITHVLHRETFLCLYCTKNLRIEWCLQNRLLVSVKIKLQEITSGNDFL